MKKNIFLLLLFNIIITLSTTAQCKEYIKSVAKSSLSPYTLDGNFFSPIVFEGDKVELTRTFMAGQKYKISVVGMDFLEKKITITDQDGFIVFKNYQIKRKEEEQYFTDYEGSLIYCLGSTYWEFELEQSQNLTITVEIEQKAKKKSQRLRGCLGIVVGFFQ